MKPLRAVTLLFLLAALPAAAGAELELVDGRVLAGTEVERQGRLYLLRVNADSVVPIPARLVQRVRRNFVSLP